MPLYMNATAQIRLNLQQLQVGQRAPLIRIGVLTDAQFDQINSSRFALDLHVLEQNEIVFIGKHVFNSRSKDGYTIDDMVDQIVSAMSPNSILDVTANWSRIDNPIARADRYGNMVNDRGVFEMTAKKPRAELFSVMPKGDTIKPPK